MKIPAPPAWLKVLGTIGWMLTVFALMWQVRILNKEVDTLHALSRNHFEMAATAISATEELDERLNHYARGGIVLAEALKDQRLLLNEMAGDLSRLYKMANDTNKRLAVLANGGWTPVPGKPGCVTDGCNTCCGGEGGALVCTALGCSQ